MKLPSAFLSRVSASSSFAALAPLSAATSARSAAGVSSSRSAASVFGIGVDIAHIPRFVGVYQRHGLQFLRKCLHADEIAQLQRLPGGDLDAAPTASASALQPVASFLASRWAVKEAMVKATGKRLLFPEMKVHRVAKSEDPRAHVELSGEALRWFQCQGLNAAPLLSLSHDGEYAVAFVCVQRQT